MKSVNEITRPFALLVAEDLYEAEKRHMLSRSIVGDVPTAGEWKLLKELFLKVKELRGGGR